MLKERAGEQRREGEEGSVDYAFHVHGDYSTEWVKCLEAKPAAARYFIRTILLPNTTQEVNKHYLLLGTKSNA